MRRYEDFWSWTIFWKTIKCGSLTQAALSLGIDPAVASRQVSALENEVGTALLNRRKRPVTPTPAGEALYEEIGPLIAEFQRFVVRHFEDTVYASSPYVRSIRVCGPQLYVQSRLRPLLAEYMEAHAKAMFCVYLEKTAADLANRTIDVLVSAQSVVRRDLISFDVRTLPKIILASPSYLEKYGEPAAPEALLDHVGLECLTDSAPGAGHFLYKEGRRAAFGFGRVLYSENAAMLLESAIHGDGILFDLPAEDAEEAIRSGALVQILKGWHAKSVSRSIVMRHEDVVSMGPVYDFVQWFVKREREEVIRREARIFERLGDSPDAYF